ncbi:MAG: sugar-binding protein [Treponema sp.]|jgi:putative multiple sugar transport system substrate-binding protein|nr:sugar-binding protein [Treponema sp.]
MKKFVAVLLILLVAGSLFAGGGKQSGATFIGMAMPETHVERWVKDGNQLKAEAEKRGYRAEAMWANGDQPTQNQQVQSFLTQGAKALVIGNINDGVGPVVAEAKRENVHVIAYDRIIQGTSDYGYFITFNNYKVGTLQGQSIIDGLNLAQATSAAPKFITLFAGSPTDANANFFFQGAMDVLLPHIERGALRVVGPFPRHYSDSANFQRIATEGWQAPIAKTRMENLLNNDARDVVLDAVLAPNDTLGMAILEACKADAKYRTKLPVVSGQDAQFSSMMSIKNGEQYSTVFKDTAKLAEAAVLLADQLLKGQPISIPGAVIAAGALTEIGNTGRGYVTTYLLDPVLVTKNSNFLAPVTAGFYPANEASQLR